MRAAIVGGPGETPTYSDFPEPSAKAGEVLLSVAAAALSPLTRARAAGTHYSTEMQFPIVAGVDGVGRREDGQRVFFMLPRAPFGGMAERTVLLRAHCVSVPAELDDVTAALIANPGMSSWAALTERAGIRGGETVLINGATGASGQLAIRIARHLGAGRVVATGRNASVLASLQADETILIGSNDDAFEVACQEQFEAGVDVVLDYLWGESARRILLAAMRAGSSGHPIRFVQIGSRPSKFARLPNSARRAR